MSQELVSGRPRRPENVTIENAKIFFKNFSGRVTEFNPNIMKPGEEPRGKRDFACALPQDAAEQMLKDKWNVKYTKVREEGDVPEPWLPIAVNFANRPPRVVVVAEKFNHTTGNFEQVRTTVGEDLVGMLDYADIENVDLMINPYPYNYNGRQGIKAYLQAIYVTIRMDALEAKYASIPEVDLDGGMLELTQYGEPDLDDILDVEYEEVD